MYEEGFYTVEGEKIFTYEYVEGLRKRDKGKNNPLCIVAQPGAQEQNLAKDVDILITGGNRGGAKSFTLLMEALKDVYNPRFCALLLRNEKDDLRDLVKPPICFIRSMVIITVPSMT